MGRRRKKTRRKRPQPAPKAVKAAQQAAASTPKKEREKKPWALTDQVRTIILEVIRSGGTPAEAADKAGITRRSILGWVKRGKEARTGDEAYVEFAEEYNDALQCGKDRLIAMVRDSKNVKGLPDPKGPMFLLERRFPDEFSKTTIRKHVRQADLQDTLSAAERFMSPEAWGELLHALDCVRRVERGEDVSPMASRATH